MIKNDDKWIIEGEEDLKDPFMCYCLMMKWTWEAEEDYIDQNESIVMPVPFIMWLNGRRYITNDQADELLHVEYLDLQKIVNGEVLFPNTCGGIGLAGYKGYQLLAEYISCFKELRARLYGTATGKAYSMNDEEFYKNKDGISLACILPTTEFLVTGRSDPKRRCDLWDWTYADVFEKVKNLSIEETDIDLEY